MKKRAVTIILIALCAAMLYWSNSLATSYYNMSNYSVDFAVDRDYILFDETTEVVDIDVSLRNNTRRIISSENGVFLSYHLLDADGNTLAHDNPRFNVGDGGLEPLNSVTVSMTVSRPAEKGSYLIEIDLVEENKAWFEDEGGRTLLVNVRYE